MRLRLPGLFLLSLCLTPLLWFSAQGKDLDQDRYTNARLGLTVTRPGSDWRFLEQKAPGTELKLKIYAPKASCYFEVTVAKNSGKNSIQMRDAWVTSLKRKTTEIIKIGTAEISSKQAPWLEFSQLGQDKKLYRARYHFVIDQKRCYTVSFISLLESYGKNRATLKQLLSGVKLTSKALSANEKRAQELNVLAARCGSQMNWAKGWTDAQARAKAEKKLIAVFFHDFKSYPIPNQWLNGPLANTDVRALFNERFVCLAMDAKTPANMRRPDKYGLSGSAFGSALILFTAEGSFLKETNLVQSDHVYSVCLQALTSNPGATGSPIDKSNPITQGGGYLRRGDFGELERVLSGNESAEAHLLRARSYRLQRQGAKASKALKKAWTLKTEALLAELLFEQGRLQMGLGQLAEAEASLKSLATRHPKHQKSPEALFWLGACRFQQGKQKEAVYYWEALIAALPNNSWSWKAAANLLGQGAFVRKRETLVWFTDKQLSDLEAPPATIPFNLERAEQRALNFLLKSQVPSGQWQSPRCRVRGMGEEYSDAVTAIAGLSLIPYKDKAEVSKALQGALQYFKGKGLPQKVERERSKGWYSNWRRAYTLRFLAEAVRKQVSDKASLESSIKTLIEVLSKEQRRSGGWPYAFIPGDPKERFDPSTSFTSAAVIRALRSAQAADFKVDKAMMDRASAYLKKLRMPSGGYRYFEANSSKSPLGEAAGRAPLCTLTLFQSKKVGLKALKQSLDVFMKQRQGLVKELRKEICHTGPQGQGSHYFFFDYRYAAAAVRLLPEKEQGPYRAALLADIAKARYGDGSYVSMPGLGRVYGSAMALMCFYDLRKDKRRF